MTLRLKICILSLLFVASFSLVAIADYQNNRDGTVTDTNTGLIWQQNMTEAMRWENAMSYCEGLVLAGHSDWRLPTVQELLTLVDYNRCFPATDTAYFQDVNEHSSYWTSTIDLNSRDSRYAWIVQFYVGYNRTESKTGYDKYRVRAVCGTPPQFNNFVGNGDGTITDTATGLMWEQDAHSGYSYNWEEANELCSNLLLAGYSDWRLPTIKELLTLIDYNASYLQIDTELFNYSGTSHWSSTTNAANPDLKLVVSFKSGEIYGRDPDLNRIRSGYTYSYNSYRTVRTISDDSTSLSLYKKADNIFDQIEKIYGDLFYPHENTKTYESIFNDYAGTMYYRTYDSIGFILVVVENVLIYGVIEQDINWYYFSTLDEANALFCNNKCFQVIPSPNSDRL